MIVYKRNDNLQYSFYIFIHIIYKSNIFKESCVKGDCKQDDAIGKELTYPASTDSTKPVPRTIKSYSVSSSIYKQPIIGGSSCGPLCALFKERTTSVWNATRAQCATNARNAQTNANTANTSHYSTQTSTQCNKRNTPRNLVACALCVCCMLRVLIYVGMLCGEYSGVARGVAWPREVL